MDGQTERHLRCPTLIEKALSFTNELYFFKFLYTRLFVFNYRHKIYDTNPFVRDDDSLLAISSEQFAEEHLTI